MSGTKSDRKSKAKAVFLVILVCFVSIMAFLPASWLAYGAETSYVQGYVVNEDGAALGGIIVELISGGTIEASTFTNPQGYFVMPEVERGTYSLHLKKSGYAEVLKSVTLQTASSNLGTTVMLRALRLSTSTLSIISNLGEQLILPFSAENSGEDTEVVDFSVSKPDGWSTRILGQSYQVTKVSIPSGQSMSLQLEVTIPLTALADQAYNVSVTAIGTTNASLTFTVLTRSQPIATVSGRIVDESGIGLQAVTVTSYSSDGMLINSTETSSDGYFTLELPVGDTVSLKFSKQGYVEATKTVSLDSATETIELDETVLIKALTLYASSLNAVANPGEKLLIPFAVSNTGEAIEIVELSTANSNGWSTRVLDQNNREIKNVAVVSGSTLTLKLEVMIPMAATGASNLTLTAAGKTTSKLDFLINVEPTSESVISCQFPGKQAIPGDPVVFLMRITNPFDSEMRFKIFVNSTPSDWTAFIKTADDEHVTDIILGAEESVDLAVELDSSASAATGENYNFSVTVESGNQTLGSLLLTVALNEPEAIEEIGISTKFPEVTVEAGEVAQYQITVTNLGDTSKLLFLSIAPPADWKAVFKSGELEISRLDIAAGSSEELVIAVSPPSTVNLDTYDVPVQIKSESGVVLAEVDLKATIIGSYGMRLSLSTLLTSTTSGESTSFTATVINTGFSSLSVIGLDIEAEDGWDVRISPSQVDLLRPQESFSFRVDIDVPSDTVSGDYLVTLTALSEQIDSAPTQVRVTVNTPTSWGVYGIGIAVLIIILLVLIFRKFKRR